MEKTVVYSCPNCGANLVYSLDEKKHCCQYCGGKFTGEEIERLHPDNKANKQDEEALRFENESSLYNCPNCGAQVVAGNENSASAVCHYCHSALVLAGRVSGSLKPDYIIPFNTTKDNALNAFKEHCKRKFYLPKDFKSKATLDYIRPLYAPFWLADAKMDINFDAVCEKHTMVSSNRRKIDTYKCHRRADIDFNKVPVDGSARIDNNLMHAIEPFDFSKLQDFSMSYLQGVDAEKYDVHREALTADLQKELTDASQTYITENLSKAYNRIKSPRTFGGFGKLVWHYTLLPVWFLNYKYKGKDFMFVMNGQTGKFAGILPVNKVKLTVMSIFVGAIIAAMLAFFAAILIITIATSE